MASKSDFLNKRTNILSTARAVIYNKYVLYLVFIAALLNLLYSVVNGEYMYCTLFVLIGFVTAFFSKNMTVILTLTMAVATIIHSVLRGNILKVEGFDGNKEESEDGEKKESPEKENVPNETPAKLMEELKDKAMDLQDAQKHIINGFEKIEPYMDKAESLIHEIQNTAKTIQDMRNKEVPSSK